MYPRHYVACIIAMAMSAIYLTDILKSDTFLTSLNENLVLGSIGVQLSVTGFCLAIPKEQIQLSDGAIEEEDYTKQSIYALLYSVYDFVGDTAMPNTSAADSSSFTFTFNTWGFGPSLYGDDPQRFGKTAYSSLMLFDAVQTRIGNQAADGAGTLRILEIGSGTGAGSSRRRNPSPRKTEVG